MATITILENFEDTTYNFPMSNPGSWALSNNMAWDGTNSFQKRTSAGYVDFTLSIPTGSTNCKVSFYTFTDCNASDPLIVTLDGTEIHRKSGSGLGKNFTLVEYALTPGTKTLRFNYAKTTGGSFTDSVYIDTLKLVYDEPTAQPVPQIDSVSMTPNPVNASQSFLIAVAVSEIMV